MDKPFKTIQEQIAILESRGLIVDEKTPEILEREGYYSVVNGYKDLFLDSNRRPPEEEAYVAGTLFSNVYRFFSFDRDLRLIMFRYFAQAEAVLKTVCAYRFSEKHQDEAEPYLNPENYRQEESYRKTIDRLIDDFKRAIHKHPYEKGGFKRRYIEHYVKGHDEAPLWVLTNYLMLGQIFRFYDCQPESMRNYIAKGFSELYAETHDETVRISPRRLRIAYDHIKDFRNICAHDERLYCARVSPSKDTSFADLLSDLALVLTRDENARMQGEVIDLVLRMRNSLGTKAAARVMWLMGAEDLGKVFFAIQ